MFKYFREMRELKLSSMRYKVILLGKLYDWVQTFDGGTDILELANKMKDVKQEDVLTEIIKNIKSNEKSE